jgi:large subunit ribosomal protein L1
MSAHSKRYRQAAEHRTADNYYPIDDALKVIKETASAKFDETVDVSINLGVNAKKSDQNVRVAVFADGADAEAAKGAGADVVGLDDLAETIKGGKIDFDICIATPATMRVVGKLGQVLGPRGLMPNPKVGTVTQDVAKAVGNAKAGQVQFRIDKAGVVHCPIGKASFDADALKENLMALLNALNKAKPSAAKGQYLRRLTLSTTMGPGVKVDRASVS